MHIWINLITALQVLSALAMIGLVLVQHGKGADMGASFGSGSSGSLFGASGSANFLSRSTAACATIFFACTLGLTYLEDRRAASAPTEAAGALDRPAGSASSPSAPAAKAVAASAPAGPAASTVAPSK